MTRRLSETLPGVFEQTGTPRYYEEFADVDDPAQPRKLRLFPAPTSGVPGGVADRGQTAFSGFDGREEFARVAKRG